MVRSWLVLIALTALGAGCWNERAPAETTLPSRSPPPSIATLDPAPAQRWPGSGARFRRRVEDRCAQVVGHMFDLARQDGMNNGFAPAMLDDFQASTIESCHETEWSEESLGCYADTTSTSQMGECYRSMTTEQREDFEQRFLAVRSKHRTTPSPPPPP